MVLGTCGRSDAFIEGWPLGALATQVTASGTSAYWSEVVHAQGGQYRLCWCSGSCNSAEEFRADLGSLSVIGPAPLQYARTCISGRQCVFEGLAGEGLSVGDSIQLLSTCGTHSAALQSAGEVFRFLGREDDTSCAGVPVISSVAWKNSDWKLEPWT